MLRDYTERSNDMGNAIRKTIERYLLVLLATTSLALPHSIPLNNKI